jgi:hypothetical protein
MSANQNIQEVKQAGTQLTLKDVVSSFKEWGRYLVRKWKLILLLVIIGAVCGGAYSKYKKPVYIAETSFVFEEGKSGPDIGGLSALVDVSDGGGGLFSGADNIVWLYSSRLMLQKTLFIPVINDKGKKTFLISWFIEESGLQKQFDKSPSLKNVRFPVSTLNPDSLSETQNAIVGSCVAKIKQDYLAVKKNKGTKNIIIVDFSSKDELLAKVFSDELVKTVNDFYIQTKTKKTSSEVEVLQRKADSAKAMINSNMYQAASAIDAVPYLNPSLQVLKVRPQQRSVDVQVSSAIYTETVKLLEKRRIDLAQETPLIQVIDQPILPLFSQRVTFISGIIKGALILGFLTAIILIVRYSFRKMLQ